MTVSGFSMTDQAYRRARLQFGLMVYFPIWFLAICMFGSILAFHASAPFRDWLDPLPQRLAWLSQVFPTLDRYVAGAAAGRIHGLSLGFYFYAYAVGVAVNVICVAMVAVRWRTCRALTLERLRRTPALRRRFDNPGVAMSRYALIGFGIVLVVLFTHWWDAHFAARLDLASRRDFYDHTLVFRFPAMIGAPVPFLLGCLISITAVLDPAARALSWGVAVVREEDA
jgi:hypothetical protein